MFKTPTRFLFAETQRINRLANKMAANGIYQLQLLQVKLQELALTPPLISRTLPRLLFAETLRGMPKLANKTVAPGTHLCSTSHQPLFQ